MSRPETDAPARASATFTRCFFKTREGDTLIWLDGSLVMDRYAIVPLEDYNSLIGAVRDFREVVK